VPAGKGFSFERRVGMTTVEVKGEKMRQAVKWISEMRQEQEGKSITPLIQEAALRFNLSPREEEFLVGFLEENRG
jgi:hypothetical protein